MSLIYTHFIVQNVIIHIKGELMSFNQYNVYSTILTNTLKDEDELKQILGLIQEFDKISDVNVAKKYLEAIWNIKKPVDNFPICNNLNLSTKENENGFKINFTHNDESIIYYYKK